MQTGYKSNFQGRIKIKDKKERRETQTTSNRSSKPRPSPTSAHVRFHNTALSVVQKMEADNNNNRRIYYEDLYFVKMLVLMYFLNLGKEQWQKFEKIRYFFLSCVISGNVIKFGKIIVERRW